MKKTILLFCVIFLSLKLEAQLNNAHNSIRTGDIIIKQQVEFKDPGEAKANQTWNFSNLKLINDEYEVEYSEVPLIKDSIYIMGYSVFPKTVSNHANLIIGTEHNTMYYFYQTADSLVLLGHENVAIKQENIQPIINLMFPLNYGEMPITSKYKTRGLYSGSVEVQSEGYINMHADAFGMMILPSGDTINPVVRVKTEQSVLNTSKESDSNIENNKGHMLEGYRWYSKGYRYPIFEAIQYIDQNTDSTVFSTAFYFPPQEHYYLDTDPENQTLLDTLWNYTNDDSNPFKRISTCEIQNSRPNFSIYPNPVSDILSIEYTLTQDCTVNIILATIDGKVVKNIFKKQQKGAQFEQFVCSNLMTGIYLLKIVTDELVINERIIKK